MTKTVKFLLGTAAVGAIGAVVYVLMHDKKILIEDKDSLEVKVDEVKDHISDFVDKTKDALDDVDDKIDDFVETAEVKVVEAKDKVEEVTKDVVNRISRELAKSNNYDIPPYEISHDTYVVPMGTWKKATVFYDNDKFHGIYGEEYKPFVLGQDNIDHFINDGLSVMYIRNENLECDYAVYKGEENGEN